jgi:hypothetical protein
MGALLGAKLATPLQLTIRGLPTQDCQLIQGKCSFPNNCQAKELDQLSAYLPDRKFRDLLPIKKYRVIVPIEPALILIGYKCTIRTAAIATGYDKAGMPVVCQVYHQTISRAMKDPAGHITCS